MIIQSNILTACHQMMNTLADLGGACPVHAPPMGPNSFIFAYIFTKKCPHQRSMPPPNGCMPPLREILDPPLEYVTLLKYAKHLNIDLTTFPTLWAVLSILLNTQDGKHKYVKHLQEEYNTYYEDKPRKF